MFDESYYGAAKLMIPVTPTRIFHNPLHPAICSQPWWGLQIEAAYGTQLGYASVVQGNYLAAESMNLIISISFKITC